MYNVKELIEKMKHAAGIKTNTDLAKELEISYNTLNTWLKREKLPQETIYNFATKYNCSLDYLLLATNSPINADTSLFSTNMTLNTKTTGTEDNSISKFTYYGEYDPLNIKPGDTIELNSTLLHSNGHYLLKYDNIYFIAKVSLNIFTNIATISLDNQQNSIEISTFLTHNIGIIRNNQE